MASLEPWVVQPKARSDVFQLHELPFEFMGITLIPR